MSASVIRQRTGRSKQTELINQEPLTPQEPIEPELRTPEVEGNVQEIN